MNMNMSLHRTREYVKRIHFETRMLFCEEKSSEGVFQASNAKHYKQQLFHMSCSKKEEVGEDRCSIQ